MRKKIQLLEVRSELGAGTRGASLGLGALKIASLNAGSKYFRDHSIIQIPNENELLFQENPTPNAKYIAGISRVYNYVSDLVSSQLVRGDQFVFVLAGDHSTAGGTIAGIRQAYPDKRLGVVWVDAHADLHTPYTTPSGNVHGMPLAASLGLDNLESARNKVRSDEQKLWNQLKETGGISPKLLPEELVFVGVRDTEQEEDELIDRLGIHNISVAELKERGAAQTGKDILEYLSSCDLIYISFDVDSMDCDLISSGTGTPVPDGLSEEEATVLICSLLEDERTCCMEITEINPTLDNKCNVMAETAFRVLEKASSVVESSM